MSTDGRNGVSGPEIRPSRRPLVPQRLRSWIGLLPPADTPPRAVVIRLILALVLATGLWIGVSRAEDPVRQVTYSSVPVLVAFPPGYYAVKLPPPVTVRVEGLASDLDGAPGPTGFADLTHASVTSAAPVTAAVQMKSLPHGVQVLSIVPAAVSLVLEQSLSKDVPVLAQSNGAPLGYQVTGLDVTPHTVRITGPSRVVRNVLAARVIVDASRLTHTITQRDEPAIFDRSGQPVSRRVVLVEPADVSVTVHVRRQQVDHLLPVVPNLTGLVASGYGITSVVPYPMLVDVVGSTQIPATTTLTTQSIDVSGWTTSHILLAQLVLPPHLRLRNPAQATVTVTIDVVQVPGSAVSTAQVQLTGLRPGTRATVEPASVTVAYQGGLPLLQNAPAPQAMVDLHNRPPGSYTLTPSIVLGPGLSPLSVTPPSVRVKVSG